MKRLISIQAVLLAIAAGVCFTGCAGTQYEDGRADPSMRLIDFKLIARKDQTIYLEFIAAVKTVDHFIRNEKFFYEDYQGRDHASLTFENGSLVLNGDKIYLCLGSRTISFGNTFGAPFRFRVNANAAPRSIHFDFLSHPFEPNINNTLFYDVIGYSFSQKAHASSISERLLHELTHVLQMRKLGPTSFYIRYVKRYFFNLIHPFTYFGEDSGPYNRIGFEIEARRFERMLHEDNAFAHDRMIVRQGMKK